MQKDRLLEQALPSLFPFSLPPPAPLFAPATQANAQFVLFSFEAEACQDTLCYARNNSFLILI